MWYVFECDICVGIENTKKQLDEIAQKLQLTMQDNEVITEHSKLDNQTGREVNELSSLLSSL